MLYDAHVFVKTWHFMNEQMDWTDEACSVPLPTDQQAEIAEIQRRAGPTLTPQTVHLLRRFFYSFDYEHGTFVTLNHFIAVVSDTSCVAGCVNLTPKIVS